MAIAARYAQKYYGVKKVAILDWDIHHGDSTQRIFEDDPSVLFVSLHRYDKAEYYPGDYGAMENIGKGEGKYYNINIPWDCEYEQYTPNSHDLVYVFERFIFPVFKEF